jgi:hypothetical protein
MFFQLRKKLKRLTAPRKVRTDALRVRCWLERLEDRAMLSASHSSIAHSHGGADLSPHAGSTSHFGDSAAYASFPSRSTDYEFRSLTTRDNRISAPTYPEKLGAPPMQFDTRWSPGPMRDQFAGSRPPTGSAMLRPGMENSTNPPLSPYPMVESPSWNTHQMFLDMPQIAPQESAGYTEYIFIKVTERLLTLPSNTVQDALYGTGNNTGNNASGKLPDPNPSLGQTLRGEIGNGAGHLYDYLRSVSAQTDGPAASQYLSREINTAAVLSAVAHDLVFQEYPQSAVSIAATNSYDRANIGTLNSQTAPIDELDGFINPTDPSIVDELANTKDAVAHEREAVDTVLQSLHSIDTLVPADASADLNLRIDQQTESLTDDLPASEIDGGMVLLQSAGNANESGFDLTPVYASQFERFNSPAKMETSVGMFQAIDVASDETPISDSAQKSEPTIELNRDIKLDDQLPAKREKSTHKAAALLGATTLTGALVWLNRSASKFPRPQLTAQKRRASRS